MNLRAAALLGLGAIGCSLLVPLDYTGGKTTDPSTTGGTGGSGGIGGSVSPGDGGTTGEGGAPEGGAPEGGAPEGGSDAGGDGGSAGSAAQGGMAALGGTDDGGKGGSDGGRMGQGGSTGGEGATGAAGGGGVGGIEGGMGGMGGMGGLGGMGPGGHGGRGGRAGDGGTSGMAGAAAGNAACPTADLATDEMHCGSCTTVCGMGEECLEGGCRASPCDGLCATWTTLPTSGDGYRKDPIGDLDVCFENVGYDAQVAPKLPSLICWNYAAGRVLEVNGQAIECKVEPGATLTMSLRVGGYCIHAGAGKESFAGLKLPLPGLVNPPP